MVPDTSQSPTVENPQGKPGTSTAVNALIGGIVGIVLSFVPLSTLVGGAVAGYLEGGTTADGVRVGALAGAVMLLPFVLIGAFFAVFFLGVGAGPGGAPIAFGFMILVMLLFGALYTVGLSAVGGYLGIYVKNEL